MKNINDVVNNIIHVVCHIFLYFNLRHLLLKHHVIFYYFVEIILYRFIFVLLLFNL